MQQARHAPPTLIAAAAALLIAAATTRARAADEHEHHAVESAAESLASPAPAQMHLFGMWMLEGSLRRMFHDH